MKATDERFSNYRDKIYDLLWKLKRHRNNDDMHSFKALKKDRFVWVEYDKDEQKWFVKTQNDDGCWKTRDYSNCAYLANQLAFEDLDLESVEI